jgi:hypothetical protein
MFALCHATCTLHASQQGCDESIVLRFVQRVVPEARTVRASGTETTIELPATRDSRVAELLGLLQEQAEALGVRSYGVAMPSLEEVFLRLQRGLHGDGAADDEPMAIPAPLPPIPTHECSWTMRVALLAAMRARLVTRNWRALFFQVLLPPVLLTVGLSIQDGRSVQPPAPPSPLALQPALYGGMVPLAATPAWDRVVAGWALPFVSVNASAMPGVAFLFPSVDSVHLSGVHSDARVLQHTLGHVGGLQPWRLGPAAV